MINFGRLQSAQRLRQVHRLDNLTTRQIGNRARQLENSMVRPRRQIMLGHRRPDQPLTLRQAQCGAFVSNSAELAYLPDAHVRIADDIQ